jgi:hypothetical protein
MPRDANGNVTLPAGNPVVSDTDITTSWGNTTMADLATMAQDSLSRTGKGGMLVPFKNLDGTTAAPGITFTNQTGTGFSRSSLGIAISIAGTRIARWITGGLSLVAGLFRSEVADGATAVAFTLDTDNDLTTAGAKLLSIQNKGVEKFAVDKDGNITVGLPALNRVISNSSGAHINITGDTLWHDIPNLTVTITTSGNPVHILVEHDGSASTADFSATIAAVTPSGVDYRFLRDGTDEMAHGQIYVIGANNAGSQAPYLGAIDVVPAGTYTYVVQMKCFEATTKGYMRYMKLTAYEM